MEIRRYVRVLSERCETFKDLWILRMRLQIGIKHTVKIYSPFLTIYSDFFLNCVITSFAIQPIIPKVFRRYPNRSKMLFMHFYDLFSHHLKTSKKIEYFLVFPEHWLKYKSFKRKFCDENHNGFNHKILKWQHNRIKSWKKHNNQPE